ncbi:MAG: hypothetical protein Q4B26_14100 [Eubacteriales bacterium]|nr:hypothetical protein [Eubacteriales bacterium]
MPITTIMTLTIAVHLYVHLVGEPSAGMIVSLVTAVLFDCFLKIMEGPK